MTALEHTDMVMMLQAATGEVDQSGLDMLREVIGERDQYRSAMHRLRGHCGELDTATRALYTERDALHAHIEDWRRRLIEAMDHSDPGRPMWAVVAVAGDQLAAHRGESTRSYPWTGEDTPTQLLEGTTCPTCRQWWPDSDGEPA